MNNPESRNGFTLVEVLIALTIFAIGVLGIISLQSITLVSTDTSGNMSLARILASDQLERIAGMPYGSASLSVCSTAFCHSDVGNGLGGVTPSVTLDQTGAARSNGRFLRDWNVTTVATGILNVTVRVRWTDVPGGPSSARARTYNRTLQMSSIKIDPS